MKKVKVIRDCTAIYQGLIDFKRGMVYLAYPVSSNSEMYSICLENDHFLGFFLKKYFEDYEDRI